MSSFREKLGEDWLRYQHHLDGSSPSTITHQPTLEPQPLPNGLNNSPGCPPPVEAPQVLPPPLLSSEPRVETADVEEDQETESTLQWPGHSSRPTESTMEDSAVHGPLVSSPGPSPESQMSTRRESVDTREEEEEEEDLGGRTVRKYCISRILMCETTTHKESVSAPVSGPLSPPACGRPLRQRGRRRRGPEGEEEQQEGGVPAR